MAHQRAYDPETEKGHLVSRAALSITSELLWWLPGGRPLFLFGPECWGILTLDSRGLAEIAISHCAHDRAGQMA